MERCYFALKITVSAILLSGLMDCFTATLKANVFSSEKIEYCISHYLKKRELRIEGKVILEKDTLGLQHTTIRIKETGQVFQTDSAGVFVIDLPKDLKAKKITLTFSHHGYKLEERIILRRKLPVINLIVKLYIEPIGDPRPELPLLGCGFECGCECGEDWNLGMGKLRS